MWGGTMVGLEREMEKEGKEERKRHVRDNVFRKWFSIQAEDYFVLVFLLQKIGNLISFYFKIEIT